MSLSVTELDAARRDPVVFADVMVGEPLWPHQVELVRSPARYRVINAGRRSGKSRVYGVLALHMAFSRPFAKVLIVSAGEVAAKRLFAEVARMARAPRLGGSTEDETMSTLTLSNGSQIECVPASEKQVRSAEADLLIVDEAGFVAQGIWESAEPVILARPGSRVLISSTPWGGREHFFRQLWQEGMDRPDEQVRSWHWPSSISPLVDQDLLERIRQRSSPDYFAREYLAEWTDEAGTYLSESEIMSAVADYELLTPERAREASFVSGYGFRRQFPAVAGIDWGLRDANALVLLSPLDDLGLNDDRLGERVRPLYVPWLRAESGWPWSQFIDYITDVAAAFDLQVAVSETNGVGAYPTDELEDRLRQRVRGGNYGGTYVAKVWTDTRRKQSGYGKIKGLLQRGQLVLPRHPELLKQLRGLQFEQLQGGSLRIEVPAAAGHDDLADALMQAVSAVQPTAMHGLGLSVFSSDRDREMASREYRKARARAMASADAGELETVTTGSGLVVPSRPMPALVGGFGLLPAGQEKGDVW